MEGHTMYLFMFDAITRSKKMHARTAKKSSEECGAHSRLCFHPSQPPIYDVGRTTTSGVPHLCPVLCCVFSVCLPQVHFLSFSASLCAPGDSSIQIQSPGIPGGCFLVGSMSQTRAWEERERALPRLAGFPESPCPLPLPFLLGSPPPRSQLSLASGSIPSSLWLLSWAELYPPQINILKS